MTFDNAIIDTYLGELHFMVKKLITEISEDDFRKLNLKAYVHKIVNGYSKMIPVFLNDVLDNNIAYCLETGYEEDKEFLSLPVYIAIHEENNEEFSGYLDKFMNGFTGLQTFQFGMGIKHLYSTRDYYEDHEDYWKVKKKETAIIYKIILDKKWLDKFVLKHKNVITKRISIDEYIETHYDLNEETGEWVKAYSSHVIKKGKCTTILPYKEKNEDNFGNDA